MFLNPNFDNKTSVGGNSISVFDIVTSLTLTQHGTVAHSSMGMFLYLLGSIQTKRKNSRAFDSHRKKNCIGITFKYKINRAYALGHATLDVCVEFCT